MSKATIDEMALEAIWQIRHDVDEILISSPPRELGDSQCHTLKEVRTKLDGLIESANAAAPADDARASEAREHLAWLRKTAESYVDNIRIVGFEDCLRIFMAPSVESYASPRKDEVSMATLATEAKATEPSTSDEVATEQQVCLTVIARIVERLRNGVKDKGEWRRLKVAKAAGIGFDVGIQAAINVIEEEFGRQLERQSIAQPPAQQPAGVDEQELRSKLEDLAMSILPHYQSLNWKEGTASAILDTIRPHLHPQPAQQEADDDDVEVTIAEAVALLPHKMPVEDKGIAVAKALRAAGLKVVREVKP